MKTLDDSTAKLVEQIAFILQKYDVYTDILTMELAIMVLRREEEKKPKVTIKGDI